MKINIEANSTIAEVQQAFHKYFPFLKIEFYKVGHQQGEGSIEVVIHFPFWEYPTYY